MKDLNFRKIIIFFTLVLFSSFFKINAVNQGNFESGFYIIESLVGENKVIDVNEASNKAMCNVQLWSKNNSTAQIFYIDEIGNGFCEIRAVCSGMALDVECAQKKVGANVWQYPQNYSDAQKWYLENCYGDVFKVKSKLGNFYLDVECARQDNGTNIRIWEHNNTSAQKFKFRKVDVEKYGLYDNNESFGVLNFKMDYAKKLLRIKNYIYNYYLSKNFKNVLVLGDHEFLKNFDEIFKPQNKFKYELKEKLPSGQECDKYDFIINEKYNGKFLKFLFPNKNLETFRDIYPSLLYQTTIDFLNESKIPIYFFEAANASEMKNFNLIKNRIFFSSIDELSLYMQKDILDKIFGNNKDCKNYFISGEFNKSCNVIKVRNHFTVADFKGKYCNIIDHHRFLKNAPENNKNNIYMYGSCMMRGRTVSDNYTIAYFMQEHLNKDFGNRYRCMDCGLEAPEINDFEYILDTDFKPGDMVIEERDFSDKLKQIIKKNKCSCASLSAPLDDPNIGNFSIGNNFTHFNHVGCRVVAEFMYGAIKEKLGVFSKHNFGDKIIAFGNQSDDDQFIKDNPDFVPWLDNLKSISKPYIDAGKKIGSLNVNCNPFTKGHRYLIEESLKRVDHLFLFVVEEDASEFSFKDRYEMVRRGIEDLDNITLLTTGKWMCSKFTFPDYFDKDALQSKIILNPTKDIELYGKYIAPALGATVRFAGNEPLDLITCQHNNFMKEKLPSYGVKFCEIPRKTLEDGQVISASKVRKYLKDKNFKELQKLVPKTTYDYLLENFA